MSWTIPTAATLAERYKVALEAVAFTAPDGSAAYVDAHTPGLEATLADTHGISNFGLYLFQAYIAREMLVSTARDQLVAHAIIWEVPQLQPTPSVGTATASGTPGTSIVAGTLLQGGAVQVMATVAIGAGGSVELSLQSVSGGSATALAAGAALTPVSPIGGLTSIVLDAGGLAGGTDLEAIEAWRARIMTRIRVRPGSGKPSDYVSWAIDAGAAMAACIPNMQGPGTVGVVVAMAGATAPTAAELATIQASIVTLAPVTATVLVIPAVPTPVPHTIALLPDTTETRAAAQALLAASFAASAAIGTPWYLGDSWAALRSIPGLTAVEITTPAANVAMAPAELPTLGAITFGVFA